MPSDRRQQLAGPFGPFGASARESVTVRPYELVPCSGHGMGHARGGTRDRPTRNLRRGLQVRSTETMMGEAPNCLAMLVLLPADVQRSALTAEIDALSGQKIAAVEAERYEEAAAIRDNQKRLQAAAESRCPA
eukprot:SAG22_NODE_923_length_6484_cov_4.127800_1_plen_132_part_10